MRGLKLKDTKLFIYFAKQNLGFFGSNSPAVRFIPMKDRYAHCHQVYLTWVSASNLQKHTFVIPALYINQSAEIVAKTSIFKPFGHLFVTLATDKPIKNGFTTS
ncbi:hypothetical protein ASE74_17860 [Pedobacter sp. Leaf216]|nr:hypothetical protein ASE74_17860 [Pedobacter sp. Leaf216]